MESAIVSSKACKTCVINDPSVRPTVSLPAGTVGVPSGSISNLCHQMKSCAFSRSPVAFVHLIVMNLVFFSSSTTFYGVIRLSVELPGSMYANFALESFFELFSTLYTALALNFLGRKFFTMFGFFVAGIALPMAASVQHHLHKVSLCILGKESNRKIDLTAFLCASRRRIKLSFTGFSGRL